MRKFLQTRVAIPKCSQLQNCYLFDVYQTERAALKELVANKQISLIVDELSDGDGRFVLDIMAVFLDFDELSPSGNSVAWLLDSHFLTQTNNRTVSQAVVKTVHDYGIEYDNVHVFNSDNGSYMKKAFCDTLSCLFPYCIHITCHSHTVNLVASDFKKEFEVTKFVKCFRNLFYQVPSGRKSRFLKFLQKVQMRVPPCHQTQPLKAGVPGLTLYFIMRITSFSSQISFRKKLTIVELLLVIHYYDCKRFIKIKAL